MAGVFSSKMAALVALLVVFVTYASYAEAASGGWLPAKATWYGSPNGAGPDDNGGACGFKNANKYPYMSMTSCGNQPLFKDGAGCGSCYQIRCLNSSHPACSGKANRIIITDMNYYPVAKYHFDLSGTAFGAMAKPGLNDKLRHAGIIDMEFRRVPCNYKKPERDLPCGDRLEPKLLRCARGVRRQGRRRAADGHHGVQEGRRHAHGRLDADETLLGRRLEMMDSDRPLQAPFSLRIRSDSGKTLVANKVIPANWKPMTKYSSNVQFPA
ncbi:hypothetical protein PR202_ga07794 [Eleusine coracana subsp. coracana]|uniref:Expansin-like EG45 domain-containing protein n=1 Tax=Eleusine coracana subsp. coracana TaxID=191504 RepID=A0AAV5C113_ELECO|nr:hypothetical protein PR202_ga07794 [Eleusine coracana subsp. coracana]